MSDTATAPLRFVPARHGRHSISVAGRVIGRIDALPTGKLVVELFGADGVEIVGLFVEYDDAVAAVHTATGR